MNLQRLIEREYFIICQPLDTHQFISYCKERSINTSKEQLEQFEKLGIFRPIVRVEIPKIKIKVEYVEDGTRYRDMGKLEEGESWDGDIKEEYAHFWFEKEYAESWFEAGILWDPASRAFQEWKHFRDQDGQEYIRSYYSVFQAYTLYNITRMTRMELGAEWWYGYSPEDISRIIEQVSEWAHQVIDLHKKETRGGIAPAVCQILSNRYYPKTQTDRRTINLSVPSHYHNWDWHTYCRNWKAGDVLQDLGVSIDDLKKLQEVLSLDAKFSDPMERWYGLISFVSLDEKKRLKGKALLAQLIYSMEHMIRLFYKEVTGGQELLAPEEVVGWKQDDLYGEGVSADDLQYLEFLTNRFHLNPRPKLILVVEGNGEEEQFPRLSNELFGYSFSKLGIEVVNLRGVSGFTGKKGLDRYGALEKFIDYHHNRQTIVFVVLDNEGRTKKIKEKLIKAHSKYYSGRFVTKEEYIHLWEQKTIEFDNFDPEEIAHALSEASRGKHIFGSDDIEECRRNLEKKEADYLSRLFKEKVGNDLSKPELLKILFGYIIKSGDTARVAESRPVVALMRRMIELASQNYQPTRLETRKKNQESGYLGETKK
jgi:hypothetical protein